MTAKDIVKTYYETLRSMHYKPMECWGRDGKWAKKFLESGRTAEDFARLLHKALVGPKEIQIATCQGLHRFMYILPKIELLDQAPWEPSPEERAANVRFIETATHNLMKSTVQRVPKEWIQNGTGHWIRNPERKKV